MHRFARALATLLLVVLALVPSAAWAAYSGTCTVTSTVDNGRHYFLISLVETQARDTSEATCLGLPFKGTIMSYEATLTAGSGTTIDPDIGRVTSFSVTGQDNIANNATAAAHIANQDRVRYFSSTGKLFIHSNPNNVATDHSISTEILIAEGWEE